MEKENNQRIWQALEKALEPYRKAEKNFQEAFNPIIKRISTAVSSIQANIEKTPQSLITLAEFGWYISFDFEIREILENAEKLRSGQENDVNKFMVDFYTQKVETIQNNLVSRFPHRSKPILSAIEAHKSNNFYLSIPIFFAQTDGICKELTGKTFFGANRNNEFKPYTHNWPGQLETDTILRTLLEPLKNKGGFNKNFQDENQIDLTRHSVLHGENNEYGTEVNSFKALSMLNYIADIVFEANKKLLEE